MTLRRDHFAALLLIALGLAAFILGTELPFGTTASPGPGMMPFLVASILIALAVVVLINAGSSPPFAEISWDDFPHAARVMFFAVAAAALYTTLGFVVTIGLMLFGLIWGVERMPLLPSLLVSAAVTGATFLLLSSLLKTPMPQGILGF